MQGFHWRLPTLTFPLLHLFFPKARTFLASLSRIHIFIEHLCDCALNDLQQVHPFSHVETYLILFLLPLQRAGVQTLSFPLPIAFLPSRQNRGKSNITVLKQKRIHDHPRSLRQGTLRQGAWKRLRYSTPLFCQGFHLEAYSQASWPMCRVWRSEAAFATEEDKVRDHLNQFNSDKSTWPGGMCSSELVNVTGKLLSTPKAMMTAGEGSSSLAKGKCPSYCC